MPRTLILFATALALRAQSGMVTVEVRDALTKAPLPNVTLTLARGTALLAALTAQTGADGTAKFEHLPAGAFHLGYKLAHYLDSEVSGAGRLVQLKDDAAAATVTIFLMPVTIVEGTVLDEDGHPVPGVTVHTPGAEATTDSEGRYRLARASAGPCRIGVRIPTGVRKSTLKQNAESGESFGYPGAEYYPGVADPEAATIVQIAGGVDLRGYDVRLRRVRLADFSGRILERAGGDPLPDAYVELQTAGVYPPPDESFQARAVDADGAFRFELIQPGPYVLLVYRGERGTGLPYVMPVEVSKTGVANKEIVVPPFQTIQGTVRVKGGATWSGQISLSFLTEQKGVAVRSITVKDDHFALDDIPPGQWQIEMQPGSIVRLPERAKVTITGAYFGVSNPLTGPITVTESGNPPLEIELSSDTGRIAGTVSGTREGFVIVQRVGAARSFLNTSTRIKEDGSFLSEDLAPGVYEVRLNSRAGKATKAEVKSGETTLVHLDIK